MASSSMPKQLAQLPQEQQDPFVLELYLLERGHVRSKTLHCCRRRKLIPNCSKIVKTLINKLLFFGDKKKGNSGVREIKRSQQETAESDWFSCSGTESDVGDGHGPSSLQREEEIAADRRLPRKCRGGNEESPVSVLEKLPSNEEEEEDSPIHHDNTETIALQQKQLLFDWVREILVENRRAWEEDRRPAEELGKLLVQNMRSWSKLTNTNQQLNSEFTTSVSEWCDFEAQIGEIGLEIGDAILEEIIGREIVVDIAKPDL